MTIRLASLRSLLASQLRETRLHWFLGVRFAIACGVPPIVGVASGHPLSGVIAGVGALYADPEVLRKRTPA
jgi:hypothetical protein